MKYILFGFIAFVLVGSGFIAWHTPETTSVTYERETTTSSSDTEPKEDVPKDDPITEQSTAEVKEIEIQPGDTFSTIMEDFNVPSSEQSSILAAVQDVYDFTKLQAGKLMHVVFAQDALASIDYDLSDDTKIVVENVDGMFVAKEETIEYDITETVRRSTIESSLFLDGSNVGLSDKTLVELAELFQWDIDFTTDIQVGDSFTVLYEERKTKGGEDASVGKILAAQFTNQGETYDAYYFETADDASGYYSASGESIERQFLSSPISIGYISSGFSYSRVNPVTKQVTPHRAIDYAAPHGTPVVAIADGEVSVAGSKGGLGITVEIEHGGYMSQYAHLSKIAAGVKRGADVSQGEVIGYVGSTGISTGPHLQYAFFKDGAPINPLKADLPLGETLAESVMNDFAAIRDQRMTQLESQN
jgi:murein DD-endopeptidase MepM/ murein hydrolase activator NlpD